VKGDVSSPTFATESVLLTCTIDAFEGQDIATINLPGAFLQAKMEAIVHARLTDVVVDVCDKLSHFPTKYS
jgi:hypothetical protein